ncbi:DHR1 family SFII helicase [Cryptosporidium ubiquitum]|uniref:RNA helicase n=1 Tax=Cryptosporidium ubiquitum TaxID=857276 RepID=A0A1J4MN95_9CRYT|nr:DHR1 family SFII helicase [Cryptosporidium ubiquitum]OII75511.1 DHR1 family SFII helicase [Cryptosporidium ubiquitum]
MEPEKILEENLLEHDLHGSNALILPTSKIERKRIHQENNPNCDPSSGKLEKKKKMSNRKRRKLKQLEEKKRLNKLHEDLTNDLKKYTLSNEELQLMMSITNSRMNNKQKQILRSRYLAANLELPNFLKLKDPPSRPKIDYSETILESDSDSSSSLDLDPCSGPSHEQDKDQCQDLEMEVKTVSNVNIDSNSNSKLELNSRGQDKEIVEDSQKNGNKSYIRKYTSLVINNDNDRPSINRTPEIEFQRSELPVRVYEFEILDAVENNDVTIVTGATGSGKSTQVPQLLYEAGYCQIKKESSTVNEGGKRFMIGLTQPRRIAATSLSNRIGEELNDPKVVGYQIRYDKKNCTKDTVIKVMTDGVLLQEIQKDLLCSKYTVILIDEAHERTVNTDILIGLLSRIVIFRREEYNRKIKEGLEDILPPLKLIIMSATLRVTDFSENPKLFSKPPPVINIETPNFPVTLHFAKNTPKDYISAAYKKIQQIHNRLPPGSILVFVTGKKEVNILVNMINKKRTKAKRNTVLDQIGNSKLNMLLDFTENNLEEEEIEDGDLEDEDLEDENLEEDLEDENLEDESLEEDLEDEDLEFEEQDDEESKDKEEKDEGKIDEEKKNVWEIFGKKDNRKRKIRLHKDVDSSVWKGGGVLEESEAEDGKTKDDGDQKEGENKEKALEKVKIQLKAIPLYASMSFDEQKKAFKLPESNNIRHVIISTNVSETSITIPNVRYVIDTGKEKRREYSKGSESSRFVVEWISKASASQRSGRAGRVGPGHCYRLYSSAIYENVFSKFAPIDILSIPLDSVLLYMHSLGIPDIVDFPFPTPPEKSQIDKAYELLTILGSVESKKSKYVLTNQGISLSNFPLSPRYAKILLLATAYIRKNMLEEDLKFSIELLQQVSILVSYLAIGNLRDESFSSIIQDNQNKDLKNVSGQNSNDEFESLPTNLGNDIELNLWFCIKYLEYYGSGTKKERSFSENFCKRFELNSRGMSEIRLMSIQLFNITKKKYLDGLMQFEANLHIKWPPKHPNFTQKHLLRTFFISCFIDHIAIRNDGNLISKISYQIPNDYSNSYSAFIHPKSILISTKPKFLIYSQVITSSDNNRHNLCDCLLLTTDDISKATSLKHPLIDCSKILSFPTPYYSIENDSIVGYCTPKYRNKSVIIDLPSSEIKLGANNNITFEIFARAILNGQVFREFNNPRILKNLKSKNNNSNYFKLLVHTLEENVIFSKSGLISKFKSKRDFLLKNILQLYEITVHNDIRSFWPPTK